MCRWPLCSLLKMFHYIHSLGSFGVSDAVAENKAQKTLAFGEWEFNRHQLEKGSRAQGAVPLAGSSAAALGLGVAGRFQEPQLLQPVPEHRAWPWWHDTRGACWSLHWVYHAEGRWAGSRAAPSSFLSPFPSASCLVPFKICL